MSPKVYDVTDSQNKIFNYVGKRGIVVRADVLSPDEYMPPVLIGRDDQIGELAYMMRPLFLHGALNNGLIFGSPGCGKTATSKYVLTNLTNKLENDRQILMRLEQLGSNIKSISEDELKELEYLKSLVVVPVNINLDWTCISCKEIYTTMGILFKLIQHLDPNTQIKRSGYSIDYYYDALFLLMNQQNKSLMVILDEIDFLKSYDVLYTFSRAISSGKFNGRQFIRIIGISNSRKFEEKLDPRILSSIGFKKFRFQSYNTDDIYHILKDRIKLAFTPGSIDDETIIQCAKDSANTGGDVRKVLNVLQTAAETADVEGSETITIQHVKDAEEKVQDNDVINAVLVLPLHHRIILMSIAKFMKQTDSVSTGDITTMYEMLCRQINQKPSIRQTVSEWITSLDMQGYIQSTKIKTKSGGKTRMISIPKVCLEQTEQALYGDYQLEELEEYFPVIKGG